MFFVLVTAFQKKELYEANESKASNVELISYAKLSAKFIYNTSIGASFSQLFKLNKKFLKI